MTEEAKRKLLPILSQATLIKEHLESGKIILAHQFIDGLEYMLYSLIDD